MHSPFGGGGWWLRHVLSARRRVASNEYFQSTTLTPREGCPAGHAGSVYDSYTSPNTKGQAQSQLARLAVPLACPLACEESAVSFSHSPPGCGATAAFHRLHEGDGGRLPGFYESPHDGVQRGGGGGGRVGPIKHWAAHPPWEAPSLAAAATGRERRRTTRIPHTLNCPTPSGRIIAAALHRSYV